ncbi:MAG: hypothetical protein RL357_2034 [Pseudomonadota bacterium]
MPVGWASVYSHTMITHAWTPLIIIHASSAGLALVLGAWVLWKPKGTRAHRMGGRVWVLLMALVALSSLGIYRETYSWIHALSFWTLAVLPYGVVLARKGQVAKHKFTMRSLYIGALVIAGLFTLLPQRLLGQAVWGFFSGA